MNHGTRRGSRTIFNTSKARSTQIFAGLVLRAFEFLAVTPQLLINKVGLSTSFSRTAIFAVVALLAPFGVLSSVLLSTPAPAYAAINQELNFQARLLDTSGGLVDDGNYNVQFNIYSGGDGVIGGGDETLEWTGSYLKGNTQGVDVVNGYVIAQLGETASDMPLGNLSTVDWNNSTLWLSINIGDTSSTSTTCDDTTDFGTNCGGDGEMGPYIRLASTPYAFNAGQLEGRAASEFVQLNPGASAQTVSTGNTAINITQNGAGALLNFNNGTNDVLTVAKNGSLTVAGTSTVLRVDTATGSVAINDATPDAVFDINGNNATRNVLQVTGFTGQSADIAQILTSGGSELLIVEADGDVRIGGDNNRGTLQLSDGGTGGAYNTLQIQVATTLGQNSTITIPDPGAASDTICLVNLQNCGSSGQSFVVSTVGSATESASPTLASYQANGNTAAAGDGDQIQINAAIAAASAAGGGTVYLMEGTYTIDAAITAASNVDIVGSGNATIITLPTALDATLNMIDLVGDDNVTISNLRISGNKAGQGVTADNDGIGIDAASDATVIENVQIVNMYDYGINSAGTNARISNVAISGSNESGVQISGTYAIVTGSNISNNLANGVIIASGGTNANITGNTFTGNGDVVDEAAVNINADWAIVNGNTINGGREGVLNASSNSSVISNNTIYNSTTFAIRDGTSQSVLITGNTIVGSGNVSIYTSNATKDITISNNTINSSADQSIIILSTQGALISGNNSNFSGRSGVYVDAASSEVTVDGNRITSWANVTATYSGIEILSDNTNVTNNILQDESGGSAGSYGIRIDASADGSYIAGNSISVVAPVVAMLDSGTNSVYSGQQDASGNLELQAGTGVIELLSNTDITGTLTVSDTATFNGDVTIATGGTFQNASSTLFVTVAIGDLPTGGDIGSAATTVDVATAFSITQTTASQTITLPSPTNTAAGRIVYISNIGSTAFIMYGDTISAGSASSFIWSGSDWDQTVSFSSTGVDAVGALNGGTANADGATITGTTIYLQSASENFAGLVDTAAQTFAGVKTFNNDVILAAGQSLVVTGGNTLSRPDATLQEGEIYYDSETNQLLVSDGTQWNALNGDASSTFVVAASDSNRPELADYRGDGESGDGLTTLDGDQVEIELAIAAANALGGGTVYLMEGTYTVDDEVSISANVSLVGSGSGTIITIPNALNPSINLLEVAGADVSIRSLQVDGNKANQTGGLAEGIQTASPNTTIEDVKVVNAYGDGIQLFGLYGKATNVHVEGASSDGLEIAGAGDSVTVTGSTFVSNGAKGLYTQAGAANASITGNTFTSNVSHGVQLDGEYGTLTGNTFKSAPYGVFDQGEYSVISSNTFLSHTTQAIRASSVRGSVYDGNLILTTTGNGIDLGSSAVDITISNNSLLSIGSVGISVASTSGVLITGNTIEDTGDHAITVGATSSQVVITGNRITEPGTTSTSADALNISSDNTLITDNYITYAAGLAGAYGISINAGADNNYLANNSIFVTSPIVEILDSGLGTIYASQLTASQVLRSDASQFTSNRSLTLSGTSVAVTAASPTLTGTATAFNTELAVGDRVTITDTAETYTIKSVASPTVATFTADVTTTDASSAATKKLAALAVRDSAGNTDLVVTENGEIYTPNLTSCTALETDVNGLITCGSDADSGATLTLQDTYSQDVDGSDVTIALTSADDSLIVSNPASGGTDSGFAIRIEQLAVGAVAGLEITNAGNSNALTVNDDGTFSDTTPFIINASGNVGIGTTTANTKLAVLGDADIKATTDAIDTFRVRTTGNSNVLAVDTLSERVVIGGVNADSQTSNLSVNQNAEVLGGNVSAGAVLSVRNWTTGSAQDYSILRLSNTRGTSTSPTATQAGDILGAIHGQGFDTTESTGASIEFVAAAEFGTGGDSSDSPADILFNTVEDGTSAGKQRLRIGSDGSFIINDDGYDADFRIEGVGQANALVVQGSDGFVGIGTAAPGASLDVRTTTATGVNVIASSTGSAATFALTNTSGAQTSGLAINRNGAGGTTTSLLSLTNTAGTATNGIVFTGTIGTDITTATNRALTIDSNGTGSISLGAGTGAKTINLGTGGTGAKTINVGGTAANVIGIGNTQTAGSISLGAALTTGTINIGGTGLQTGTISLGNGTGAQIINLGTGGTGVKTINLGGTAANVIGIGNTQTAGSISLGAALTTGTINIGGTGLQTGTISLGNGTGAQIINLGTGGTGAKTVTLGSTAGASVTTVNAGSGGISLGANTTTGANTLTSGGLLRAGSGGTNGAATAAGDLYVQDALEVDGNTILGDVNTDTLTINAGVSGTGITFADSSFQTCVLTTNASGVLTCATSGSIITLQSAYDGENTIDTTDTRSIVFTLTDTTADGNFDVDIASGSSGSFRVRDGANSNATLFSAGTLAATVGNNTGATATAIYAGTGGISIQTAAGSAVVVNEGGLDTDFRVEGDTQTNLLFVNAGTDSIGIGNDGSSGNFVSVTGAPNTATSNGSVLYVSGSLTSTTADQNGLFVETIINTGAASSRRYDGIESNLNAYGTADLSSGVITNYSATGTLQGNINQFIGFDFTTDSFSSTAGKTISTAYGAVFDNIGLFGSNPVTITNDVGVSIEDRTGGATRQINLLINSDGYNTGLVTAGNYSIYNGSTKANVFAGNLRIGATTVPTVALDVTGAAKVTQDVTIGDGSVTGRKIQVAARSAAGAGTALTVSAGTGNGANSGGVLTLQGGDAGASGNVNGGNVVINGGTGVGTGTQGLVVVKNLTFSTSTTQTCAVDCTITQANIDATGAVIINATVSGVEVQVPDPSIATAGRVLYVTAADATLDFTLTLNDGDPSAEVNISLRKNETATIIWNGIDWTAAGASSSNTLQSAYNNTLTSAGGAEIVLNASGGDADGFTIRNNATAPIIGAILEAQTSIGSNLFSVNNNAIEYATNGGAETEGASPTTFPTSTWSATPDGGTISRYNTTGDYIGTGLSSVQVVTTATANQGAANTLSTALTPNLRYSVSFAARGTTGMSTLDVLYSPDGTNTGTVSCATARTVTEGSWTRTICTFDAPASGITSANAIFIRQSDATARTFYIENLSVNVKADVNHAVDGSVDDAGSFATNWTAAPAGGTVVRDTTVIYDTSGSAKVTTTATIGQGITNNMAITPSPSTQYLVTFYARSSNTFDDIRVRYSRDGGTSTVTCVDYNTQSVSITGWTRVTCLFTTDGTTATNADIIIDQPTATARDFYVDALEVTLNTNTASNVQIGGGNLGGPTTLLTLDRSAGPPVGANNDAYLGSMYYDTNTGRIQCYESGGWGTCGSPPDNIVNLNPEYAGSVLNGTGIGTMQADVCANESGVLTVNSTLCASGEARSFYQWTSPQATQQTYSIYVTYQLPSTFDGFSNDDTVTLTGRVDNTSNAAVTYEMFRSESGAITQCGSGETTVATTANTWETVGINGNEGTGCGFTSSSANAFVIFKLNLKANSNANAYVSTLTFTTTGR